GLAVGAIEHLELPTLVGGTALITGGSWAIVTLLGTIEGRVTGGLLQKIDDTRFGVLVNMELTEGGDGDVTFRAILDHGPFPPTIRGAILQH
ncbi:MAG TPA: hypothetical protein VNO75_07720, partial [Gemmatimonadaceae bacterium]|nr:hypothetical protein [Gemmatimonadaceae bacterium]